MAYGLINLRRGKPQANHLWAWRAGLTPVLPCPDKEVFIGDTEIECLSKFLPILAEDAAHATLGASTAARWMACEGSVNLIESMPDYDPSKSGQNFAAREGTVAHRLAERSLEGGVDASMFVGITYDGILVTEEMAAHVQLYLDHVRKVMSIPGVIYWIERKFSLAKLNPARPMFGTADFAAYSPSTRTLYVDDLKYGKGIVEVKGNPQPKYYALGVFLDLDPVTYPVEQIIVTIVQPRKDHEDGVIRSDYLTMPELSEFATELLDAAAKTTNPDAALHAGDHCKWCPAKPVCPELRRQSQAIAETEFDTMPVARPPAPATLTTEQLARTMSLLPILDDWSASVKDHIYRELLAGREVPGFKLVERRAERKWGDEDKAEIAIQSHGVSTVDNVYEPQKLKSPAQIEKITGKKFFRENIAEHVVKKSSGLKLVPNDHPSPAVLLTDGTEFDLLPAVEPEINEGESKKDKE